MKPWVNHKLDIGFVFNVKGGSSTMRRWGGLNDFHPIQPHTAKRFIGIIREPRSRFISMIQQYMEVYARNTLEEDPEVFDRTWPNLAGMLQSGKIGHWYTMNVHFVKQSWQFEKYPPTEFWLLEELNDRLQPLIDEHKFTVPEYRKEGDAYIKQRIEESMSPTLEQVVHDLYPEDFDIYNRTKKLL